MRIIENILCILAFCLGVAVTMIYLNKDKEDIVDLNLKAVSKNEFTIVGTDTLHDEWFVLDRGKAVRGYSMPKYTLFLYYDWIGFKIVDNYSEAPMTREEMANYIENTNWLETEKKENDND